MFRKYVNHIYPDFEQNHKNMLISIIQHFFAPYGSILVKQKSYPGADPGFQVRGGALKKIAPSGGRREKCWGISREKSRFYAKKSYFFQF
jgi:hypothetical protein